MTKSRKTTVRFVVMMLTGRLLTFAAAAADPEPATLSDAQVFVKVKLAEMEKDKAAAIEKAKANADRNAMLKYQAELADVKRALISERAKVVRLEKEVNDLRDALKNASAPVSAPIVPVPERWGTPVFADDFAAPQISDKWDKKKLIRGNAFEIKDGMLTGKEKITTTARFNAKSIRVEYDTWTMSDTPCDATVFIENPDTGFVVMGQLGAEMNAYSRITAQGDELVRENGFAFGM